MSTSMPEDPEISAKKIAKWVSDWREEFDQDYTKDVLSGFVGNAVEVRRPIRGDEDEGKTFNFTVVGYSDDYVRDSDGNEAHRFSLITNGGSGILLYSGTTVIVL